MTSIKQIQPAKPAKWDDIWQNCAYSTYFHSREWAEIWKIYTKGEISPIPLLITFSDGKKALLPFSQRQKACISSPAGTFGGWLSTDPLRLEHAALLAEYISKADRLIWRLNPYDPLVFKTGVKISKDDETYALDLSEGFDAIFKGWSPRHRTAARKAMREGLTVRMASTLDEWQAYYLIYEDSLRRWGSRATSNYKWGLFQEIFRRKSPHIRLWVADYQNKIVAGALFFYSRNHAVGWHAAALEQYFYLRPAIFLMYESIRHACEQGYRWFDFNPSGGHQGVTDFKKNFGTKALPTPVVRK